VTTPSFLLLGMPSGLEWLVILIFVLLMFGNRIPGLARSLGSGVNEFKAGLREGVDKGERGVAGKSDAADKSDGSAKADHKSP
jgi:sec-independent protein translocase protein TatA